jgi:hypothetical protein
LTAVYLSRFGDNGADERGQPLMVRGEHGAGKTHTLGFVMDEVAEGRIPRGSRVRDVLQLYAKAEEPDLVAVYHKLLAQIDAVFLRDLTVRFLALLAGEAAGDAREDDALREEAVARLRDEPELVFRAFEAYFIDSGAVIQRRDKEVADVTDESIDLRRALSYVHDAELGDAALAWLRGHDPGERALRRLGISGPITTAAMGRRALQLIAAMCGRAGTALIVYIDQYEKLVISGEELIDENAGRLSTLVEALPRQDAMIVLAGNDVAWEKIPPDLRQRFAYNVVRCDGFALRDFTDLVRIWLRPRAVPPTEEATQEATEEATEAEVRPFTLAAIRLMHLQTRGNPRRGLQLAAEAFDEAASNERVPIDEDVVRTVVLHGGRSLPDPAGALATTHRLAIERGFTVDTETDSGTGPEARPVLRLRLDGRLRLLVMVGQSAHYYDEALDASGQLDAITWLREEEPQARAVLIVLGYASAEVAETLAQAGIVSVPYVPDTFDADVVDVLERERAAAAASEPGEGVRLTGEVEELRRTIEDFRKEREGEINDVATATEALATRIEEQDIQQRWSSALADWIGERQALLKRIQDAHEGRHAAELADLERLRAHAEAERRRVLLVIFGVVMALAALGVVVVSGNDRASAISSGSSQTLKYILYGALGVTGVVLWAWLLQTVLTSGIWGLRRWVLRPAVLRELSAPVGSLDDLKHLGYRVRADSSTVRTLLRDPNPQIRYAAALAARESSLHQLGVALPGERSATVRRAFAQRLGRSEAEAPAALAYAVESETAEAAYIYERMLEHDSGRPRMPPGSPRALHALAAMAVARQWLPATRALAGVGQSDHALARFDDALRAGLPLRHREDLRAVPVESVRHAARAVSPFDKRGLGTCSELKLIDDVDRAYVGLAQVIFLSELGLLIDPEQ